MNLQAQFKVGTDVKNINPNAMFQVDAANKGILIPRLQLVQSTNFAPLTAHVQGMIAYNTATSNDVVPGFYYNDGAKWNLIGNATGLAKVEDVLSLNNNAFRYINVNGDTVVITKVFQNVLSYDSVSKSLITNVNGVLDTVLLNVQKFDTTHVYAKIKSDSSQFAQKVDSVYVNTKGDSVFVKDGYGATTGFKLAQFDTTHVYAKIKADSSQFAQKVDSVYVNTKGDSVFVKDGYGATTGFKLAQFDTTHVYAKIKSDSTQFAQKVDSVYVNTKGDSVFVKDGYGAITGFKLAQFDTTHVYAKIKSDSTQFAQKVDSVYVNTKGDSVFVKDGYGATTGFKLAQFDTTHVYAKIKSDSSQFAQKVDSVYVNTKGDSVFVKDGYGATTGFKLGSALVKNGLNKSGDTVKLGGTLTENTTITTSGKSLTVATAGDTVRFTGLLEGKKTDSILVVDSLNRALRRISINTLNRKNVVTTAATSYTVGETEDVVIFNGTAQTTFTLPAASSNSGRIITIMNMAKSNDNVNIVLSVPVILEGITGGDFSLDKIASQSSTWTYPEGLGSNHQNSISIISNGTSWYRFGI
jgi:hypothetical protein